MRNKSSSQTKAASGITFSDDVDVSGIKIADVPERTERAKQYESKTNGLLNILMKVCLASPNTVADGAAIIEYGEAFSSKLGDLADQNVKVRRGIDLITSGTDNPYFGVIAAALPLFMQIARNHENTEVRTERHLKIPFTKRSIRIPFGFKIKLSKRVKAVTLDPELLMISTFTNPEIARALQEQKIDVAWRPPETSMNGRKS